MFYMHFLRPFMPYLATKAKPTAYLSLSLLKDQYKKISNYSDCGVLEILMNHEFQ